MSHESALAPEKSAMSALSGGSSSAPTRKARSCFVCRQRKVRCDKQSPCENCRRANIPCVLPSTDRPPRWARRRELLANNAANAAASALLAPQGAELNDTNVMDRVRYLEGLVTELSSQLQLARSAAGSSGYGSSAGPSPGNSAQHHDEQHDPSKPLTADAVGQQFGRMVLQDSGRTRYVSSGFWARIDDELDGLDINTRGFPEDDSNSSEDGEWPESTTSTNGQATNPSRYSFLFRQQTSLSPTDLLEFHPLPSQVPFLVETFAENVNSVVCLVHMPSIKKMVNEMRGRGDTILSPSNQALLFSIYYAAIASMEEDEVMTNFRESQADLAFKYRCGLENALSSAGFLDSPDLTLLQAVAILVLLLRRHDNPRYVWMMTGLIIRMAHYLGLQRDGTHFDSLTPFEVEMRRRAWWVVLLLDVRASEDQGTETTIQKTGFDTRLPLNINDADLDPESEHPPVEHTGMTEITFTRASAAIADISIQMAGKIKSSPSSLEDHSKFLNEVEQMYNDGVLQHVTEPNSIIHWTTVTAGRVVIGKLTLINYLPILFSSPNDKLSEEIRTKLLISAIEVAEHNHALNVNPACRRWRWVWQTHVHWHAVVFLFIEATRRTWSPIVERAWVALHSEWLFPRQSSKSRKSRIWIPLRKLMHKAQKHRETEIQRLRADPQAAARLEMQDQALPAPSEPYPTRESIAKFRERWRDLVMPADATLASPNMSTGDVRSTGLSDHAYQGSGAQQTEQSLDQHNSDNTVPPMATKLPSSLDEGQPLVTPYTHVNAVPVDDSNNMWPEFASWLWAETDLSIDMFPDLDMSFDFVDHNVGPEGEMNWYDWVESARTME